MTLTVQDHYSYNFKLNIDKTPTKATDRFSRVLLAVAFILGLMLLTLGLYLISNSDLSGVADLEKKLPQTNIRIKPLVSPEVFNYIISLIGCFVMYSSVKMFIRYNKICFDGNYVQVKKRPFLGSAQTFEEPLYNYSGVRLRVKFYQFGILNLNKYIVELYHKDTNKIVPLYISLSKKNIRKIWKNYATILRMPGIVISERGMVSRNYQDLNRSYEEVVSKWHLPKNFILDLDKPNYISFKCRKTGEKMIKIGKIFIDAFSILYATLVGGLFIALLLAITKHSLISAYISENILLVLYALITSVIAYATINLFTKDIILIARDKIIIFHKIFFVRVKDTIIDIKNIKGIDINYTPTTNRYYLSVVSDKNLTIIGAKLPVEDLRWIRAVLISEIIGN